MENIPNRIKKNFMWILTIKNGNNNFPHIVVV